MPNADLPEELISDIQTDGPLALKHEEAVPIERASACECAVFWDQANQQIGVSACSEHDDEKEQVLEWAQVYLEAAGKRVMRNANRSVEDLRLKAEKIEKKIHHQLNDRVIPLRKERDRLQMLLESLPEKASEDFSVSVSVFDATITGPGSELGQVRATVRRAYDRVQDRLVVEETWYDTYEERFRSVQNRIAEAEDDG